MNPSGRWIEGIDCDTSVDEAARLSLAPRLAAVVQALPLAAYLAEHDIEHVHRLRVSTRRAVAAIELYEARLPKKTARWIKKRLRRIRRAAGKARDLDVLGERLRRDYGDRAACVLELTLQDRDEAQAAIVEVTDLCTRGGRLARKTAKLLRGLESGNNTSGNRAERFGPWASEQLTQVLERLLSAMPDDSTDAAGLHQFRVNAKHVRYTIELVAGGLSKAIRKAAYPIVEEIQKRLGRMQDHVTAREILSAWADDAENSEKRAFVRELMEDEGRQLEHEIDEFRQWWSGDRVERLRQSLQADGDLLTVKPSPQASRQT